ncbi:MAG: prolyl oligopeptidase family serine peptidase [Vicinamibacterales bacterium]
MLRRHTALLLLLVMSATVAGQVPPEQVGPKQVSFPSGSAILRGTLYAPAGEGPHPAVVYAHGSAPGNLNDLAFEQLGPVFVERGWVFFAPYRRGQGLSAGAGPYVGDAIAARQRETLRRELLPVIVVTFAMILVVGVTMRRKWRRASSATAVTLAGALLCLVMARDARGSAIMQVLQADQLADHRAARAWLAEQPFVDPARIATAGNSFGGIVSVLASQQSQYCAVIDAAGGAESWSRPVAAAMTAAVRRSRSPMFVFQAANDFNIEPTRQLGEALRRAGRPYEARIYPAFGATNSDGHSFAWRGSAAWADDVFRFLEAHCRPG